MKSVSYSVFFFIPYFLLLYYIIYILLLIYIIFIILYLCHLMFMIHVDQSCFVGHWVMLWFLFCSCFLLTVGYHLQLQMPVLDILFTSKNNYMDGIIRKWERERERGEAGGVGGKGRVLRDRMSRKICQIQCFSTEALTPRIITPGKPRNSPLNQVILLFFSYYKSLWKTSFHCVLLHRK